jgi:murein DD-endopeptidase MepM/ murein hydrolase activator NlpD
MARDKFDDEELSDLLPSSLTPIERRVLHTAVAVIPPLAYGIGSHVLYPDIQYPLLATIGASVVSVPLLDTIVSRVQDRFPHQEGEPFSDKIVRYGLHVVAAVPALAASTAVFTFFAPYFSMPVDAALLLFTQLSSYASANTVVSQFSTNKETMQSRSSSFVGLGLAAILYASVSSPDEDKTTFAAQLDPSSFSLSAFIDSFSTQEEEKVVDVVEEEKEEKPTVTYTPKPIFTTWPSGADKKLVNSCFGDRGETLGGVGTKIHGGIDIRAPWHTEIYAVDAGEVVVVYPSTWGRVVIDHGNGISTEYIHLDEVTIKKGDDVNAGDVIGLAGCRGNQNRFEYCSSSITHKNAHLHFNVIDENVSPHLRDINGNPIVLESDNVNPLCYLDESIGFTVASRAGCDMQEGGAYKYCGNYLTPPQLLLDIQQKFGDTIETEALRAVLEKDNRLRTFEVHGDISPYLSVLLPTPDDVALFAVYRGMLYATIATESKGTINPNPKAKKGPKGLLQFEAATAYGYGLCDNETCTGRDDRLDPDKAIAAGAQYHARLHDRFDTYTAAVPLTFASWNTGYALIEYAIQKTGVSDPTWDQVSLCIDEQVVSKFLHGKAFDTVEERQAKVEEINAHVARAMGHYDYTALLIVNGESQAQFSPPDSGAR